MHILNLNFLFVILTLNKQFRHKHKKNTSKTNINNKAVILRIPVRHLIEKRAKTWSSIKKKANAHMKYSLSFLQMKSFAIFVHPPVSTVTNNSKI